MNSNRDSSQAMAAGIVLSMIAALVMKFINVSNNTLPLIEEIKPPKKYTIRLKKVKFTTPPDMSTTPPAIIGSEDIIEYMRMYPVGVSAKDIAKDLKNIYPDVTKSEVNSFLYRMMKTNKVCSTHTPGVAAPLWKLL
jgi:hypothetical protein